LVAVTPVPAKKASISASKPLPALLMGKHCDG